MSILTLEVNNNPVLRQERDEYGTVREAIKSFGEVNKFKGAKMIPANAGNLAAVGKQLLLIIRESDPAKKVEELATSATIHVAREISDMIRSGEIKFSALLDFPIIHHTNNSNGAEYPLVVRPTVTQEANEEAMAKFELTADSKVSSTYVREVTSIDDILKTMQI